MCDYLLNFSHLDRNNMLLLQKDLHKFMKVDYFCFLTRKNFSEFYDIKYLNIKKILNGKYILIKTSVKDIKDLELQSAQLQLILSTYKVVLFCIIYNNILYYKELIEKSKTQSIKNILFNAIEVTKNNFAIIYYNKYLLFFNKLFAIINLIQIKYTNKKKSYFLV